MGFIANNDIKEKLNFDFDCSDKKIGFLKYNNKRISFVFYDINFYYPDYGGERSCFFNHNIPGMNFLEWLNDHIIKTLNSSNNENIPKKLMKILKLYWLNCS